MSLSVKRINYANTIIQDVQDVTTHYKVDDMYADIVQIDTLPQMGGNKMVTVAGYIRKVQPIKEKFHCCIYCDKCLKKMN